MTSPVGAASTAAEASSGPDVSERISALLADVVETKREQFAALVPDVTPLLDCASHAVRGGKRLRPAFAYWGWRAAGAPSTDGDSMLRAAAAIELVHACALVHDDVIDGSATRRGQPSAEQEFAAVLGSGRQSASAAILLGDLLLSWSDELLADSGLAPAVLAQGRKYFDLMRSEVVAGQFLDLAAQVRGRCTAAEVMRIIRYKSAKYTVERPLQFGAALAGADSALLAALSSYGIPLGEAFQLRDDLLGVFGVPGVTGKPAGDDIREGKQTLLLARAYERASAAQSAVLYRHVGDRAVDSAGIAAVQQVMEETGARASIETAIAELKESAIKALAAAPIPNPESVQALRSLADRATDRTD